MQIKYKKEHYENIARKFQQSVAIPEKVRLDLASVSCAETNGSGENLHFCYEVF